MQRLSRRFQTLAAADRAALVFYLTGGDPRPAATVPMMHGLVAGGADVIELGMPFSDPMADGPVIQRAAERALRHGTGLQRVLDMVGEFRRDDRDTPVVLMGYLNPIEAMGYARFAAAAAGAGADATLIVDLPPEESEALSASLRAHGLASVMLVAPNSDEARVARICAAADGFVYYVSIKGTTGSAQPDTSALGAAVQRIRRHTRLPVGVGFGIKDAAAAAAVAAVADAVIVGSALVAAIAAAGECDAGELRRVVHDFARPFRDAVHAARRCAAAVPAT